MGIHPYCIDQLALGGRYGQYYVARLYFPWAFFLGTHFKLGPCGSPGQQYVSNPPRWGIKRTACATWLLGNLKLGYGDSRSCRHRYDNCCTKHRWLPSAIKCCNNALVYYGSTLVVPPVKQSCNLPFCWWDLQSTDVPFQLYASTSLVWTQITQYLPPFTFMWVFSSYLWMIKQQMCTDYSILDSVSPQKCGCNSNSLRC